MATPFVQGRLRDEVLEVQIETECAHCGRELAFSLDNRMKVSSMSEGADPLVFEPNVDWEHFKEPNILHAY